MGNKIIRLGDYCDIIKGSTGIKKAIPGEFPLVVTAEERQSHNEYQFDTTAVIIPLVSSTGHGHASIKRLHYQEGKFALGTILCAVLIKDTTIINPRFLYIYLSYFKDHLLVPLMKGAANVTLSIKKIKDVEIILPSLERQLEILDLESNSDLIDELTFEIQTQKQLISQLKQAILQEAIQGKLTQEWREQNPNTEPASELLERIKAEKEQLIKDKKTRKEKPLPTITEEEIHFEIPQSWAWCRLGELISISSGDGLTAKQMKPGQIPVFGGNGINGYHNAFNLEEATITIGRVGAYCGAVHLTPEFAWITDNCFRVYYDHSSISQEYLIWHLRYLNLGTASYDGSQPVISGKRIYPLLTFLPPFEEQNAIVEKVEVLMQKCNALEQEITQSEQHANMLMQAVLKEAFEDEKSVGRV